VAFWLWRLGQIDEAPVGVSVPYAATISGEVDVALKQWEEIGSPYEHALTLSTGTPDDRVRAIEELETLGATAVAARVRRELRESGIEVPRGRARTTRQNPAGLTARQLEVLGLLTEGLTNAEIADRLFLSSRTVEHHVSAILAKLGATDRVEAARLAVEAGLTE
jgi:DNA-binding NarL/FixJ family response regulator